MVLDSLPPLPSCSSLLFSHALASAVLRLSFGTIAAIPFSPHHWKHCLSLSLPRLAVLLSIWEPVSSTSELHQGRPSNINPRQCRISTTNAVFVSRWHSSSLRSTTLFGAPYQFAPAMKSSALPGLMSPLILVGALLSTVTPTSATRIDPRRAFGTACSECGGRGAYRISWFLSRSPSSSLGLSSPIPSSAGSSSTSPSSPYPSSSGPSSTSSSYAGSSSASLADSSSASPSSSYPFSSGPTSPSPSSASPSSLPPFFHEYPLPPSPSESPSARVPSGWFPSVREQKDALRTEAILLRGEQVLERIFLDTQV